MTDQHKERWSYAEITACAERSIKQMLDVGGEHAGRWQNRAVAYGIYVGWSKLTEGYRMPADDERLHKLVRAEANLVKV